MISNKYLRKNRGIFVFTDPAAENSILALVDELIHRDKISGIDFLVFTNKLRKTKLNYKGIVNVIDSSMYSINKALSLFKPKYIFCGTSSLNDFEHFWRKAGIKENIKVISFVDHISFVSHVYITFTSIEYRCYSIVMTLLCHCYVIVMPLSCHCDVNVM